MAAVIDETASGAQSMVHKLLNADRAKEAAAAPDLLQHRLHLLMEVVSLANGSPAAAGNTAFAEQYESPAVDQLQPIWVAHVADEISRKIVVPE